MNSQKINALNAVLLSMSLMVPTTPAWGNPAFYGEDHARNVSPEIQSRVADLKRENSPASGERLQPGLPGGKFEGTQYNPSSSGRSSGSSVDNARRTIAADSHNVLSGRSAPLVGQRKSEEGTNKLFMHGTYSSLTPAMQDKVLANLITRADGGDTDAANTVTLINAGLDARFQVDMTVDIQGDGTSTKDLTVAITNVDISIDSKADAQKGIKQMFSGESQAPTGRFNAQNAPEFSQKVAAVRFKVDTANALTANGINVAVQDLKIGKDGAINVQLPASRGVQIQSADGLGSVGVVAPSIPTQQAGYNPADHAVTMTFTPQSAKNSAQTGTLQPTSISMGAVAAAKNSDVISVVASDPNNKVTNAQGQVTITSSRPEGIAVGPGIRDAAVAKAKEAGLSEDQFTVTLSQAAGPGNTQMVVAHVVLNQGVTANVPTGNGNSVEVTSTLEGPVVYTYNPMAAEGEQAMSGPQLTGGAIAANSMAFVGASMASAFTPLGNALDQVETAINNQDADALGAAVTQVIFHAFTAPINSVADGISTYSAASNMAGSNPATTYTPRVASAATFTANPAPEAARPALSTAMDPIDMFLRGASGIR